MTFFLCMCLLGVWFIGAPNNITVWVELAEISHGNTCTSDATSCKYTRVCVCVCVLEQNSMKNRKPMKDADCQKAFFEIFYFLSVFETLNAQMFLTLLLESFMLSPPLFGFFPTGKCRDIGSILTCFDHLSNRILFSSQKKLEKRKILNEI